MRATTKKSSARRWLPAMRATRRVGLVLAVVLVAGGVSLAQVPPRIELRFIPGLKVDPRNPGFRGFVGNTPSMYSNLYLVIGGGRHGLALAPDDGVLLIDTKPSGWGPTLIDQLSLVTDNP